MSSFWRHYIANSFPGIENYQMVTKFATSLLKCYALGLSELILNAQCFSIPQLWSIFACVDLFVHLFVSWYLVCTFILIFGWIPAVFPEGVNYAWFNVFPDPSKNRGKEYYSKLVSLYKNENFTENPASVGVFGSFQSPRDIADHYGLKLVTYYSVSINYK